MLLVEIFDSPVKWKQFTPTARSFSAEFFVDGQQFGFGAFERPAGTYKVTFGIDDEGATNRTGITNKGNAHKVFATVLQIFAKFVAVKKPKIIMFTASEPSRIKLYDRLSPKLEKLGYHREKQESNSVYKFVRDTE